MPRPDTTLTVTATERLSPSMVRVHLGGPEFASFVANSFTDMYVKLVIDTADGPVTRTYTVRDLDAEQERLTVDFVVHGEEGVAGPWAARATPGDTVVVRGPGGAYRPDPTAD